MMYQTFEANRVLSCHIFYSKRIVEIPDGKPKWSGLDNESELLNDAGHKLWYVKGGFITQVYWWKLFVPFWWWLRGNSINIGCMYYYGFYWEITCQKRKELYYIRWYTEKCDYMALQEPFYTHHRCSGMTVYSCTDQREEAQTRSLLDQYPFILQNLSLFFFFFFCFLLHVVGLVGAEDSPSTPYEEEVTNSDWSYPTMSSITYWEKIDHHSSRSVHASSAAWK